MAKAVTYKSSWFNRFKVGIKLKAPHGVYVESVNGDGTINISEMNYRGWGVQSSRTASASEFVYIY